MPTELAVEPHNSLVDAYNQWKDSGSTKDKKEFLSYLAAVVDGGWSQSACARSLNLSRERLRQHYNDAKTLPKKRWDIPAPPVRASRRVAPGREPVADKVVDSYVKRLLALQPIASQARGHHVANSPERKASNKYSKILQEAVNDGIPVTVLAERVGRHPAGLRTRLRTAPRIGALGLSGARSAHGVHDPKKVEPWAKKLRPLLEELAQGGTKVSHTKAVRARELVREAVDPPNNIAIQALADACERSYHSMWLRYTARLD